MTSETNRIIVGPLELIRTKTEEMVQGFYLQLPNLIVALLLLVIAWLVGNLVARAVAAIARRRQRPDLGNLLGSLAKGLFYLLAILAAAAIIFPSVHPGDILAMLGIGSVAVGFAFKDILQNLLAGILLLIRRPYRRGDQIVVGEFEGSVEHIESRATLIRTYDGRRVIIPNSDIYTSPVIVNTAYDVRREELDIGIGYGDDPRAARKAFLDAIDDVEGVLKDPAPEILPWKLNDSTVDLRARWWAQSPRSAQLEVRSRVLLAIYDTAKAHGIDLPFPTQVMLFHDQTEDTDGDRNAQREGWPAGERSPRPRWKVQRTETPENE